MLPKIQNILYATDLSANSAFVMRYAMDVAVKHDASITVLHVFGQMSPTTRSLLVYLDKERRQEILTERSVHSVKRIKERIQLFCEKELKDHPDYTDKITSIEVCEGFAAEQILSKAKAGDCDMIVMGSHSKGLLKNTFLGSTAKRVLRRTRKPVFIVPLPKGETDISVDALSQS